MRVNIYAEEMTDQVEIVEKTIDGRTYTGLRFYLHLPVTTPDGAQLRGPFMHRPGDDDSSAITFWGKRSLLSVLRVALQRLDAHYLARAHAAATAAADLDGDDGPKIPRLFYFEEAEDAWCPVPDSIDGIVSLDSLDLDEIIEVSFKRVDMTDEQFAGLPEQ